MQSKILEMIRKVVRHEVRKIVPEIVSEMYIKKIVREAANAMVRESYDEELDRAQQVPPGPMPNTDQGAYQQGGVIRRKNESRSVAALMMSQHAPQRRNLSEAFQDDWAPPTYDEMASDNGYSMPHDPMNDPRFRELVGEMHDDDSYSPGGSMLAESQVGLQAPPTDIPLEAFGDFSHFGETFKRSTEVDSSSGPMRQTVDAEERRLQIMRAQLDQKIVG